MSNLNELAADILEDNIIDADEVDQLRDVIYDDDIVDREEANLLFQLNDETDVADNDDSWRDLFVEALASHVLEDDESPGVIDEDEASWLIESIEGDGQVDANEFALLLHIAGNADGAVDSLNDFTLESAKAAFLADGVIDEEEVDQIKTIIYGSGGSSGEFVDRSEADFLFDLNDAVTGEENADSWSDLFIEAIGSHVLEDDESPGVVDEDEASWLIESIEGDDQVDAKELGLLLYIAEHGEGATDSLNDFTLESAKAAFLADGVIDDEEVDQIKTIIYGSGGSSGEFVDRSEANFLFDLNDAVTGEDNADSWSDLFVEAIGNHLMEDDESPGVVDGDEAEWLIERIEGDDEYDATEKALLRHLQENAEELDQTLEFKLDLHQID